MSNDLLIKINADAKNAQKAFDDIRSQSEDLEKSLKTVAVVSGVAFAAFTAEIFFSVKAFEEARQASVQLSNALQNQGIFTEDLKRSYEGFANEVQRKTGIDNDAIIKAQAVAQTFLGQTAITEKLSFAIADLGASMGGDLNGAAEKIARTIGTGTNAFARQGLKISESATEAERYAKVLEFVQTKAGGLAAEFNKADGYTKALATSMGNFQESIGQRFAPIIEAARRIAIGFFDAFTNNPVLADFAVAAIAAGTVLTGLTAAIAAGVPIFYALTAAATAFGVASNIALLGIPVAIAGLVAGLTLLALNWDRVMAEVSSAAAGAVKFITELFGGMAKVVQGAFNLDIGQIKAGYEQVKGAASAAAAANNKTFKEVTDSNKAELEIQNADKKAAADKAAAEERTHQQNLRNIRQAEVDLLKLQNQNASAETIALKTKEIEILKALDSEKSAQEKALFLQRKTENQALQVEQNAEDMEQRLAFLVAKDEMDAEFRAAGIEVETGLRAERIAQIQSTADTELDIERKLQDEILTKKIQARNTELLEKKKYGVAYATISKALNSDEVQGAKSAAGELVQLQQSKSKELKAIGKVAAVGQIAIATSESAMNIYRGFSTIPIIGPALGVAGAAAAVAFGAERIGAVQAAADGGLVQGGIQGRDSVPFLLEPGELVVPKRNFNDVVGAVQGGGSGDQSEVVAALARIEEKISAGQTTIINGDLTTDTSYVDSLVRQISDAIQYRNGQIYGVTG